MAIFRRGPPNVGVERRLGMKKSLFSFDQYIASSRVVNGATVRCCKQSDAGPQQVGMTLIAGKTKRRCLLIAGLGDGSYPFVVRILKSKNLGVWRTIVGLCAPDP